jgi:hypothetical protein
LLKNRDKQRLFKFLKQNAVILINIVSFVHIINYFHNFGFMKKSHVVRFKNFMRTKIFNIQLLILSVNIYITEKKIPNF